MNKPTAKIRDWTLLRVCDDFSLVGHIEAHPRQIEFKKEHQRTSRLIRIDFTKMEAETQNTLYKLL